MKAKLNQLMISLYLKMVEVKNDEEGMEIIQVLVLLGLGLVLIIAFIGFKDQIMGKVQEHVDRFMGEFNEI